jgi:hypothetical protein
LEAWVSEKLGLGLYFWLRLGYHPVGPTENSRSRLPHGIISMMR